MRGPRLSQPPPTPGPTRMPQVTHSPHSAHRTPLGPPGHLLETGSLQPNLWRAEDGLIRWEKAGPGSVQALGITQPRLPSHPAPQLREAGQLGHCTYLPCEEKPEDSLGPPVGQVLGPHSVVASVPGSLPGTRAAAHLFGIKFLPHASHFLAVK